MAVSVEIAAAASTTTLQAKCSALGHPPCTYATVRKLFKGGVAIFLRSDAAAAIFFLLFILAGLLIEGSVYFVQVVQRLIRSGGIARPDMDPGSSTCSLSVLLSAVEMSLKHKQPLVSVWQGNARLIFHLGPNKDTCKINYATSNIWVFYLRSQRYVGSKHIC